MKFLLASSITGKLTRMNLLVTGTALLLAALAFFSYDILSFRQNLIRSLAAEAQITGSNSASALLFDDAESAARTLDALQESPDIRAAAICRNDGAVFAKFVRPGGEGIRLCQSPTLKRNEIEREWTGSRQVTVTYRIVFQGKLLGSVYISAQLSELKQRALRYFLIAALILIFCTIAALTITATFRRLIAQPIIALADVARRVSRDRDYSVRVAAASGDDEIAVLIHAFNQMLVQIQERDLALQRGRDELEQRVQERTAELEAANRELEAFSYTVAHDLRGPLDAIGGMLFILQREHEDSETDEVGRMLFRLRRYARDMATLIDDLLNLSRATTAELEIEPFNLSSLVRSIAEDLTHSEPSRNVQFVIAEELEVRADEGLMRVALENLLRNAWKYTSRHENARIEFGCMRDGERNVYFVKDDGAGFDENKAHKLFQPFQRLHSKSEFSGTGVGLATVQRIIARHHGRIWAKSAVEQGAAFYFTL